MTAPEQDGAPEPVDGISRLYATDLANEPEFLAARARSLGSAHANAALAALDLKVRSYSVLSLACSGTQPSQRELAEFLALDPSQIVALVDQLERRGAVVRRADPRDRRSKFIAATDAGRSLFAEAARLVEAASNESLAALTPEERDQLRALLRRIALTPEG